MYFVSDRKKAEGEDNATVDSEKKRSKRQQSFDDEGTSEDSGQESIEDNKVSANKPSKLVQLSLPAQSSSVFRPPIGNDGETIGTNYLAQFTAATSGFPASAEDDDYDA
jgi:hypothetical protein